MNNSLGETLKAEGQAGVTRSNKDWREACFVAFPTMLATLKEPVTGEAMRLYLTTVVGKPNHPNAWGALITAFARQNLIERAGGHAKMQEAKSHARETPLWQFVSTIAT